LFPIPGIIGAEQIQMTERHCDRRGAVFRLAIQSVIDEQQVCRHAEELEMRSRIGLFGHPEPSGHEQVIGLSGRSRRDVGTAVVVCIAAARRLQSKKQGRKFGLRLIVKRYSPTTQGDLHDYKGWSPVAYTNSAFLL